MMNTALPETGPDGRARAGALARLRLADVTPTSIVEFVSRGRCLVIGAETEALELVRLVRGGVECVVAVPGDGPPDVDRVDGTYVVRGGRPLVHGALGDFDVKLVSGGAQLALGAMLAPPIERFDLVVDLQGLFRSGLLCGATRSPVRVGFSEGREASRKEPEGPCNDE